ncbi:class I SAM-dependent methyltransferase [Oryzihumus sp.]|uniref:class I SAM-dependent methyltransferase n=1 Tax=Oryzihumus sp. TaxID=1968903 RepID=UPI002ED81FE4
MSETPRTRWSEIAGGEGGEGYAARFAALAASGQDVHGEATFCATLLPAPARVLDAGCGTGRVAIRLAELGYDCVGTDVDASMLAVARRTAPGVPWVLADLATLDLPAEGEAQRFDLAVAAGNVVPLLAPGTLTAAVSRLCAHLVLDGLLVTGFGLDAAHLPPRCPVTPLADFDRACAAAGLELVDRFATWDRRPWRVDAGYAVSVHTLT